MADTMPATRYPQHRKPYYVNRYMAHVLRNCVAMQFGCEAVVLLLSVAITEDKMRYSREIFFWNDQLTAYLGCRVDRLNQIRKRLVDAGWLHYEPGRKGVRGTYWVLVPGGDEQINHAALGDNATDTPDANFPPGKAHTKPDDKAHRKPDDNAPTKAHHKPSPFIPIPEPVPRPSKPIGDGRASKKFSLWRNAKREEFSDPKNVQRVFDLALKAKICSTDEKVHVFRLVASLVATTGPDDNLPGLITSVLRGDAGRDPWRARGSSDAHEQQAREWIRSLDCPPDKQRRTSDPMPEADPNAERDRQRAALKASKFAARDGPPPPARGSA